MSECPLCESEEWDAAGRQCPDCGHYDEEYHHGVEARRRRQWDRRIEERY